MKNNFTRLITCNIQMVRSGMMLLLMTCFYCANAQTISPVKYWTFNGSSASTDTMGAAHLNFTTYGSQYTHEPNGKVGKFITLNGSSSLIDGGAFPLTNAFSVEFLLKPGYQFNTTNLMKRADGAFTVRIEFPKITFSTTHKNSSGVTVDDNLVVDLNGIGRKSYGYYVDNKWHHMVFKFNAATGAKEIWVDGEMPAGFNKTVVTGTFNNAGNVNFFLNHTINYVKYFGSIDELAIYNTAIPSSLIYKHYLGIQNGQPYNFLNNYTQPLPPAAAITGPIDPLEYAPGHPSVTMSAIEQLNSFPVPRHKPGNTLLKNFNWMDPKFMGGLNQPGVTQTQAVNNSVTIQTELAKNWNYYFNVDIGTDNFDMAWTNTANANPDFKLAMVILRAQLNGNVPELKNQSKPANHYLQNSNGQFLDINGNVTTNKIWRPTAPPSSYTTDGNRILTGLNDLFTRLNRGIDMINENGEVFPFPTEAAMSKDPDVVAAKNASGLDWQSFLAKKFAENETQSYRNVFMSHPRMVNGKFTEFDLDGYPPLYHFKYSEGRKVNTMINGQYYPTTSFYPRWPSNWRNWMTAWHGWQWVVESRVHELALGDRLFSPYVSAGWDVNEETNIRPAQWLGLMKCLGMSGAEFYYSCFFSIGAPWPDSKNWIWQASIPSYAQGITSRYEEFLRSGDLMTGDVMNSYITPTAPGYSFWAGDLRKLVVVRKHSSGTKYAITGTLQPNTNMTGSVETESIAKINLDGQSISFKVRRQGSTYIYDKTNPSAPVFYQLDGWHEKTHPARWSKDFNFEGELFDNTNTQVTVKTSVPAGTPAGDFTNYTSYIAWPDNTPTPTAVEYNFSPRNSSNNTLYLWVRARSRGGVTTSMNVQFDNAAAKSIGCISDTAWTWYRFDACTQQPIVSPGLSIQNHILRITPSNSKLEIDQIILTPDVAMILNTAPPSCGSATATITASGNTSFCQGSSVILTASSGNSYQWSPGGQTTQSINVTAGGSYSVTVGQGAGCAAMANPVTVTVNPVPGAIITASGPTALCPGANVTLTAPAGNASYLWMPGGQTTSFMATATPGSYTVKVTNASGCSTTSAPTVITQATAPAATITAAGPTAICQGSNVTLTASAGSSYLWSPGGQTTQSVSASAAGSYTVRVTNAGGCSTVSAPVAVTINANPVANVNANGPTSFCTGGSVGLFATTGNTYLWFPGGQTTQSISATTTGSYSVRVTNSDGCSTMSAVTNVTVSAPPSAVISAGGPTSFCAGGSVNLTSSSGASYLWMPGGQTTQTINASTAGSYTVKVTNSSGCSATSAAVNVNINTPNAAIAPTGPTTFCPGGSVNLVSTAGAAYLWSPGGQTTQTINVTSSGSYTVRVTNSSGCSATSPAVNVNVTSAPLATITANGSSAICNGESVTLTSSPGNSYLWNNGQTTQSINVTNPGSYIVTVFASGGCSSSSSPQIVTVSSLPVATISASGSTTIQQGQSVTLTASPGASYIWLPGGETTQSITVSSGGTYAVTVMNAAGCSETSSQVEVTVIPASGPPATITSSASTVICPGGNVTLTASPGTGFVWTPGGATTQSISATDSGTYSVQVTSANGAISYADISITESPVPAAPAIMTSYIPSSSYQLTAYEPSAHSYIWSNGATTPTITVSSPGNYTVRAINGIGCLSDPQTMAVTNVAPQPCAAASMLSHYGITKNEAVLSWNPAVTADSFKVSYINMTTSETTSIMVAGNVSEVQLDQLTEKTTYSWTVVTYCNGNSLTGTQKQFTTLDGPLPCGSTPQNLQTDAVNSTYAKVSWFDTQADKFVLQYRAVGTLTYSYRRITTSLTEGIIQGLFPSTTYEWSVRSMCGPVISLYSQPAFFTTLPACPSVGIPSVSQIGHNDAEISWSTVFNTDSIRIRIAVSGTYDYRIIKIGGTPNPGRHVVRGLSELTTYDVWVSTLCNTGSTSQWGTPVVFTTLETPAGRYAPEAGLIHLNAYPNPTKYKIGYAFEADKEGAYIVKVCDMAGKQLLQEERIAGEGLHDDEIALPGFSNGLYMLIVEKGPMIGRFKFNLHE